jgi:large conductance mechanosensitive channel
VVYVDVTMPENVRNQLGAFKTFILRGNVVDLAVAVVIGAAFNEIVQNLVKGFITPLIALIGGQPDFAALNQGDFKWGNILNSVISFIIMAGVVFFLIIQPLNKFLSHVKPADDVDKPAERQCPKCLSAIPSAARRCKFCTTKLETVSSKASK